MRPSFRSFAAVHDVVVVGAGPTGLVLSALLGALDVSVLLLERRDALPTHPQAHFINQRSMEIFRPMDGLAQEITQRTPPLKQWRKFIYTETLHGGLFGEVDHFCGQMSRFTAFSPEPVAHLSQSKLLPLLLKRVQRFSNVDVQFSSDVRSCISTEEDARTTYVTRSGQQSVLSRCVVVANGANSHLVQQQTMTHQGLLSPSLLAWSSCSAVGTGPIQNLLSVHFRSKRLAELLLENPAMLYFVFNVQVVLVVVVHSLDEGEFVAQIPFFPPLQRLSDFGHQRCAELIECAAGIPLSDIQIESVRPWIMKAQTLDAFQKGNVFVAGDAAHVFPPAGGFGMNTGVQDAHNLAWKLAAVVKGTGSTSLLSSYTQERRPVVMQNSELSVENWKVAAAIPSALGLDPDHAALFSDAISRGVGSGLLPHGLGASLLHTGLSVGLRLSGYRGPLGPWRRQKVQEIFSSGHLLRLQFPQEDLGFVYPLQSKANSKDDAWPRRRQTRSASFVPRVVPGGRLPHTWLKLQPSGRIISSLDVVSWSMLKCTFFFIGFQREACISICHALSETEVSQLTNALFLQATPKSEGPVDAGSSYVPYSRLLDAAECEDSSFYAEIRLLQAEDLSQGLTESTRGLEKRAIVVRPDGHVSCVIGDCTLEALRRSISAVFHSGFRRTGP